MKKDDSVIMGIKKPDNLVDEDTLHFDCRICKDKYWREFDKLEDVIQGNGDILENLNWKRVDGEFIEIVTYKQRCNCYLERVAKERFDKRILESGLSLLLEKNTFKTFITNESWQKEMKQLCVGFVNEPKGLLALLGNTGAGKTHLGTATAGNLAHKGYDVRYLEWKKEMSIAKSNYYQVEEDKLREWQTVDVLYIDDLFKVQDNNVKSIPQLEFDNAWSIIDMRMKRNKITIISSEFTLNEIYTVDPSLAGRINEYANGNMFNIAQDENKNYRMKGLI